MDIFGAIMFAASIPLYAVALLYAWQAKRQSLAGRTVYRAVVQWALIIIGTLITSILARYMGFDTRDYWWHNIYAIFAWTALVASAVCLAGVLRSQRHSG